MSTKTRWRVMTLIAVHVLFIIHLIHWKTSSDGKTLSPVEPSESMFFIERGQLNAGVIFFGVAILATLIFGRFFCGWGCHVVALQDLCAAGMKRIGIRPKAFRSRLLRWVPAIIAFEMFIFPTIKQQIIGPRLNDLDWRVWFNGSHLPADGFAWEVSNHLMTEDFWATFVGPAIAIPFLLICGFGVVYFLGSKGFCMYGCPYGAFFSGADRLAPGRIVANLDTCEKCGECTAQCTSNVRVHEEIRDWNKVVSSDCMKCLDCVSVCPTGSLSYGFAQPLIFSAPIDGRTPKKKRFDLTGREEWLLFALFFLIRYCWRGVWHMVPMLMATGIAGCLTFLAWKTLRMFRDRDVSLHKFPLKRAGKIQRSGQVLLAISGSLLLLTAYLGVVKWNQQQAQWSFDRLFVRNASLDLLFAQEQLEIPDELRAIAERGVRNQARLRTFDQGGLALLHQPAEKATFPRLGYFQAFAGDFAGARESWERALDQEHEGLLDLYPQLIRHLAKIEFAGGAREASLGIIEDGIKSYDPTLLSQREAHLQLVNQYVEFVDRWAGEARENNGLESAISILERGTRNGPESPFLTFQLSQLLAEAGQIERANEAKARADELADRGHQSALEASRAAFEQRSPQACLRIMEEALRFSDPTKFGKPEPHALLVSGFVQLIDQISIAEYNRGGYAAAMPVIQRGFRAVSDSPLLAFRLSQLYQEAGQPEEAQRWKQRADELQAEVIRRQGGAPPTPGQ